MAGSLEVAKLVIASLLYQYWNDLNKLLRTYLTVAAVVLVLITSMGIYGFLSAAYQETANKAGNLDTQITLVETKRDNIKSQLDVYIEEKTAINKAVADLRRGLASNVIQYKDPETGQIITSTSSANRKALEKQLDQAIERQSSINTKVDDLNNQLFEYENEIVEIKIGNDLAGELGPLKYLSGLTGVPMDKIINVLLLIIIFVFDPLAISLVVAANFAFDKARPEKNLYGEDIWEDDKFDPWNDEEVELDVPVEDSLVVEEPTQEDWKVVDENDQEIKEKSVKRILQKTPTKRRVEFSDGTQGWVEKGDENKIIYL